MKPEKEVFDRRSRSKLQSAMEYLMTYGWAILLIALVLAALFNFGVFSSSGFLGSGCTGYSGYLCQNPTLIPTGTITFLLGENAGYSFYNVQVACAASTSNAGTPNPITAFNSITATGVAIPASLVGNTIVTGQEITISSLPCYSSSGAMISQNIGTTFTGYIWVNFTRQAGTESPTNPWYTSKIATVSTKVA